MSTARLEQRSYGGWRVSRSVGIGSLDTRQSVMALGGVLAPIVAAFLGGLIPALVAAVPGLVLVVLAVLRRDGVLVLDLAAARIRWQIASWRGQTLYRGQILAAYPQVLDLPGVLAPTRLLEAKEPGRSGRVGIVWNQASGEMSATLLLSPAGALLADSATINRQVDAWGQLLASLADDPQIRHAAVTIELVPEAGTQLDHHVTGRLSPDAPELAATVMRQVVRAAPQASSRVSARMTLTLAPEAKTVADAAALVMRSLAGISTSAAGAELVRRATATDLIRIVRCAFDPEVAVAPAEEFATLSWPEAGPVAAEEDYESYAHDGSVSQSWALLEAPRQRVGHAVLLPLLSPGRYARRVTLAYRTLSREEAGALLEREINAATARAEYRRRTKRDTTARDRADAERAARAAAEEAQGAGLVQFGLYVTATCSHIDQLPPMRREVEQAAGQARLRLRLARGGQAGLFAAGLPCGIFPPYL